ncbi:DUF5597 domain-containing protein [Lachnospiraceae bacterium ASD3451]|uniref:DUF5597 domain-containing protein n=1 Tax=Diplocloster agilis TaxID=2850323 RepID=UPI001DC27141|nr:DUF5597 domain-containing protein [Diplocloster agilis]MBU9746792.1 DUF5597 domain-containing protein [Diplocloster agilis]
MNNLFYSRDGTPFFSLGGQVHNSSSYSEETMRRAWKAAEALGLNTVAAPVFWNLLEPEEGVYDYSQVHMLLQQAEAHGMHLILLWFGSWKNGASQYIPVWMRTQKERFRWVQTIQHFETRVLSPHCEENRQADARAFSRLLAYLKSHDTKGIVIGVQIENEPGQIGTPRDYSDIGERAYKSRVPKAVMDWLQEPGPCAQAGRAGGSKVREIWLKHGGRTQGDWEEVFGFHAAEICTAYAFAVYINSVSAAGKREFGIPAYVNVWLGEMYNRVAGIDYPSGGAASRVLDLWKRFTPDIDAICPDIYYNDYLMYGNICEKYAGPDNPLYIPESGATAMNAVNTFRGIVEFGLCGIHCFGIDSLTDREGNLKPGVQEYANMVRIVRAAAPLIQKYQGTGRLYAVTQYEGSAFDYIDFGDFVGRVVCTNPLDDPYAEDTRPYLDAAHTEDEHYHVRGKGLIVYEGNGSFYLAGEGFRLNLIRKDTIEGMTTGVRTSNFQNLRHQEYLEVAEGHFEADMKFVTDRLRTGDECDHGLWVHSDIGVVHALLEEGMK